MNEGEKTAGNRNVGQGSCRKAKRSRRNNIAATQGRQMTTSSLDTNQRIYINEKGRKELFERIKDMLRDGYLFKECWDAELLEKYCLGDTGAPDYAYSHIRALLKKEFKEAAGK